MEERDSDEKYIHDRFINVLLTKGRGVFYIFNPGFFIPKEVKDGKSGKNEKVKRKRMKRLCA
ncbi:hypothetical protein Phum_PHUM112470 [Pediculus humanus corporis]|uniref:Uncharacterized protein n=1 Tax=Pediculus humanus subsp. corporis TaxID=121224 RepID=E0VDD4_PEDHC|nr:uncharacterized protein Phum_PHUM112470 [Pediculus humanus corporis]EEB11390.1 hypothetical protein Phum_PHUM112470 [Pediculus humanus corporis]